MFRIQIRTNILYVLIWVQTVCKNNQQIKEKSKFLNIFHWTGQILIVYRFFCLNFTEYRFWANILLITNLWVLILLTNTFWVLNLLIYYFWAYILMVTDFGLRFYWLPNLGLNFTDYRILGINFTDYRFQRYLHWHPLSYPSVLAFVLSAQKNRDWIILTNNTKVGTIPRITKQICDSTLIIPLISKGQLGDMKVTSQGHEDPGQSVCANI